MIAIQDMQVLQPLGLGCAIRLRPMPSTLRSLVFVVEQAPKLADGTLDEENWGPFESGPGEFTSVFDTRREAVVFIHGIYAGIREQA